MASEERFGYEWAKYAHIDPAYEQQFQNWIGTTKPSDFKDKDVLDAGCGMGRNSYWPLTYGAHSVTAFDNDENSLASARKTLERFSNVEIVRSDIMKMPWREKFDIAVCIGVLHHLRQPEQALKDLVATLKPGGRLIVWVYSYEGNAWVPNIVSPVRKLITSRLPLPVIHVLAYLCSVPLWIFVKIFKGPTPYLRELSTFKFWHLHSIVFDQLIPTVANYWKKDEVDALLKPLGLSSYTIEKGGNGNGWTMLGTK
jgi:SAM-dependent methyltransferase